MSGLPVLCLAHKKIQSFDSLMFVILRMWVFVCVRACTCVCVCMHGVPKCSWSKRSVSTLSHFTHFTLTHTPPPPTLTLHPLPPSHAHTLHPLTPSHPHTHTHSTSSHPHTPPSYSHPDGAEGAQYRREHQDGGSAWGHERARCVHLAGGEEPPGDGAELDSRGETLRPALGYVGDVTPLINTSAHSKLLKRFGHNFYTKALPK